MVILPENFEPGETVEKHCITVEKASLANQNSDEVRVEQASVGKISDFPTARWKGFLRPSPRERRLL